MNAVRRARVVLKGNKSNIPFFLTVLQAVYAGLNSHPQLFSSLPILLSVFLSQIQNLEACQKNVKAKVVGAAGARDDARDVVFTSVETLRIFVQSLCDQSPEQAATLAAAAGMKLATSAARRKPALGAKVGNEPGLVLLEANVGLLSTSKRKKLCEWQYTLDGKTWLSASPTPKGKTSIAGLPTAATVGFRVRVNDTVTVGEWTQVVSVIVH